MNIKPTNGESGSYNANGEMYVQGIVEGYETRTFYFGKVSEWAKDEITEANTLKLIPETMKNKDLSKENFQKR